MAILSKYKRDGRPGFENLVLEMEQLSKKAYDLRMLQIEEEDPSYAESLKKSVFNFEEFADKPDGEICELISHIKPMNLLAIALFKMDEKVQEKFKKNMGDRQRRDFMEIAETVSGVTVGGRLQMQQKIIKIGRDLEKEGVFVLKRFEYWNDGSQAA